MSTDCIFCRIIAGELPCSPVYEDEAVIAFLDIAPIVPGHTLVLPKQHHDPVTQTPDELLSRCICVAKRIVAAQADALNAEGANITQANGTCAGQVVPHLHIHVIPRFNSIPFTCDSSTYDSPEEMQRIATDLRTALITPR